GEYGDGREVRGASEGASTGVAGGVAPHPARRAGRRAEHERGAGGHADRLRGSEPADVHPRDGREHRRAGRAAFAGRGAGAEEDRGGYLRPLRRERGADTEGQAGGRTGGDPDRRRAAELRAGASPAGL
ncbi:MAG: DnaK suppressor protein, partial [uncultured Rubrobacteraceae bacterium]